MLEPELVAKDGVEACLRGKPIAIPGLGSRLSTYLLQCLPRVWVTRVFGMFYRKGQA